MNPIPVPRLLYSTTNLAATENSDVFDVPMADAYAWILEAVTPTGTSPTLNVKIQISPDDGTTFWTVAMWAQVTTATIRQMKLHTRGPVSASSAAAVQTIIDTGTSAVERDMQVTPKMRLRFIVAGTNPNYATVKVWLIPIYNGGNY